jgi:hypothetical protein
MKPGIAATGMMPFVLCARAAAPQHGRPPEEASDLAPLDVLAMVAVPAIGGIF